MFPHWWNRWWALVFSLPVLIALTATFGWLIDGAVHSGQVMRNVDLEGRSVGGVTENELAALVSAEIGPAHLDDIVELRAPGRTITTTASQLGLLVDVEATVDATLSQGRDSGIGPDLVGWTVSFFKTRRADTIYRSDPETLRLYLVTEPAATKAIPVEPSFESVDGRLVVTDGVTGLKIAATPELSSRLEAAASNPQRPIVVKVEWDEARPLFDEDDVEAAIRAARELSAQGIVVTLNNFSEVIRPQTVRRWIVSDDSSGFLVPVFDELRVKRSLEVFLSGLATDPIAPSFAVVEGSSVSIDLGDPVMVCCDGEVAEAMYAVASGEAEGPVQLIARLAEPDGGLGSAEALGVETLVGEFTTNHACCGARVENIHRMADLVRGALILPGDTFSINEFVGERTIENGFVAAGAIEQGHFVEDVGGGVSQFATTIFNAAFFAGLDFTDYQSHSIYISRYPRGREATLGHPAPDLALTNNTPYAMLVWAEYTETSITVQLWSTPYFEVEQTGQSTSRWGPKCTRVDTFRQRTDSDGRVLDDSVFAIYRPGEGLDCFGNKIPDPRG
ncbi:MAG: VanW family protein [Acidimicrobiia bacterium]|nr:VanW family protein [Acidimicrobiia bacterium]